MKTNKLILGLAAISILFTSCEDLTNYITPSSNITTKTKNITDFNGIDVSSAFNVFITFNENAESVEIEANENLHNYIIVEKVGSTLTIGLKDNINIRNGSATLNATIKAKSVSELSASGASYIIMQNKLVTDDLLLDLSGASNLNGSVLANKVYAEISGASVISLSGKADYFSFDASGASEFGNYYFSVNHFDADLSGASNAQLTVNQKLDIQASGASSVQYKGSGTVSSQDLSGYSEVKKVN